MEPRIATHTSIISQLRKKWFVIKNFERVVKIRVSTSIGIPKESHQVHSFYELLYDPETGYSKDSEEETYVQQ